MSSMRGNLCRYRMLRNCFAVTILLGLLISMTDAIAQDTKPRVSLKTNSRRNRHRVRTHEGAADRREFFDLCPRRAV